MELEVKVVAIKDNIHCNNGDELTITGGSITVIPVVKKWRTRNGNEKQVHFYIPVTDVKPL